MIFILCHQAGRLKKIVSFKDKKAYRDILVPN